jgi:hypothetical protein
MPNIRRGPGNPVKNPPANHEYAGRLEITGTGRDGILLERRALRWRDRK